MTKSLLIIIALIITNISFSDDMPPEVKRLKEQRDRQVAKKIKEIDAIYHRELDKLKKKYAAQKNYIAAAYIENMQIDFIDSKTEEKIEKEEVATLAKIECESSFLRFRNEVRINDNRPTYFYTDVPDAYEGWEVTFATPKTPDPLVFTVKKAGVVTLVSNAGRLLESKGWVAVEKAKLSNQFDLMILEKILEEGEYSIKEGMGRSFGTQLLKKR